jgi:hypothetical protein
MGATEETPRASVLIVAHRTAATPKLLAAVTERAGQGECAFTLLVPRDYWEEQTERAAAVVELALPLLEQAAGRRVEARIGDSDPLVAVRDALADGSFDEVIISTLPQRISRWLHRDLPGRVRELGLPVTVVMAAGREQDAPGAG